MAVGTWAQRRAWAAERRLERRTAEPFVPVPRDSLWGEEYYRAIEEPNILSELFKDKDRREGPPA